MGPLSPAIIAIIVISVVVVLVVIAVIIWCYCRPGKYRSKEDQYKAVKAVDEESGFYVPTEDKYRPDTHLTSLVEEDEISNKEEPEEIIPRKQEHEHQEREPPDQYEAVKGVDEESEFSVPTEDKYPPQLNDESIIKKQEEILEKPDTHLTSLAEEDEISNKEQPEEIIARKQEQEHQEREPPDTHLTSLAKEDEISNKEQPEEIIPRKQEQEHQEREPPDQYEAVKAVDEESGFCVPTEDKYRQQLNDEAIIKKQEAILETPDTHLTSLAEEDEISNKEAAEEIIPRKQEQEHQEREPPDTHLTSLAEEDKISNKEQPQEIIPRKQEQEHQVREPPAISRKDFNTLFYFNKMKSAPNGDYVENIHRNWWADYDKLERHHGYIQWLFPIIGEQGLNPQAKELQPHEAEAIIQESRAMQRVLNSYRMMLDFFGMRMSDVKTGVIERGLNWDERFYHLNHSHHNYLRITRILKSMGCLGYQYLQEPLVEFLISEIVENNTLSNCEQSCKRFWIKAVRDNEARERLEKMLP